MTMNNSAYEARVRQLESEGLTRSDAQSVADVEEMKISRAIDALWPYLMKNKDHPEQRLTAHGFKNKADLAAYIMASSSVEQ